MKKPRTASELIYALDDEYAWRLAEIQAMKRSVRQARSITKNSILRAVVPLLYAHWEGFVKNGACLYVRLISSKRIRLGELRPCFRGLKALEHVKTMHGLEKKVFVSSSLLERILQIKDERFQDTLWPYLERVGNMDYEVFVQVATYIGIDSSSYMARKPFIDETLIGSRNRIAHGEYLAIGEDEAIYISDEVLEIIRRFKNDLENAAVTEAYRQRP